MSTTTPSTVRPGMAPPPRDAVTPAMIEMLQKTKPWVRFMSIIGFLMSAFLVVAGIGVAAFSMFMGDRAEGAFPGAGPMLMIGLGLVYICLALLYIIPSRYLFRYASAIKLAMTSPVKTTPIEEALRYQKSFWKFVGIFTLLMILLYIGIIVLAIMVPSFIGALQSAPPQ